MVFYAIFLFIFSYILYKTFLFNVESLKGAIYNNLVTDISRLNYYHPIHSYVEQIPTVEHISLIYNKLGIINYNDYIYGTSLDSQTLNTVLTKFPDLRDKATSVVMADIVNQNAQLFGDLAEQLMKRMLRTSAPLFVSVIVFAGIYIAENLNPSAIGSLCSAITG